MLHIFCHNKNSVNINQYLCRQEHQLHGNNATAVSSVEFNKVLKVTTFSVVTQWKTEYLYTVTRHNLHSRYLMTTTSSLWEFERRHIFSPAVAPHSNSTCSPSLSSLGNLLNHSQGLIFCLYADESQIYVSISERPAEYLQPDREVIGTSKSICQIWAHLLSHFLLLP